MQGVKVYETVTSGKENSLIQVDLNKFGKGIYIVEMSNSSALKVEKVVVK